MSRRRLMVDAPGGQTCTRLTTVSAALKVRVRRLTVGAGSDGVRLKVKRIMNVDKPQR